MPAGEIAFIKPYIKALWIPSVIASITQYYLPWPGRIATVIAQMAGPGAKRHGIESGRECATSLQIGNHIGYSQSMCQLMNSDADQIGLSSARQLRGHIGNVIKIQFAHDELGVGTKGQLSGINAVQCALQLRQTYNAVGN